MCVRVCVRACVCACVCVCRPDRRNDYSIYIFNVYHQSILLLCLSKCINFSHIHISTKAWYLASYVKCIYKLPSTGTETLYSHYWSLLVKINFFKVNLQLADKFPCSTCFEFQTLADKIDRAFSKFHN